MENVKRPTKPRIFLRPNGSEWCCIVKGDPHSRMGAGADPLAAYRSWEFYNSSMGHAVAREVDAARRRDLDAFLSQFGED